MTAIETHDIHDRTAEDLRRETEEVWQALNACDKDTYNSVISFLREAGLLRE